MRGVAGKEGDLVTGRHSVLQDCEIIAAGDEYLRQAVDLQIDSAVVYAAFPKRE